MNKNVKVKATKTKDELINELDIEIDEIYMFCSNIHDICLKIGDYKIPDDIDEHHAEKIKRLVDLKDSLYYDEYLKLTEDYSLIIELFIDRTIYTEYSVEDIMKTLRIIKKERKQHSKIAYKFLRLNYQFRLIT